MQAALSTCADEQDQFHVPHNNATKNLNWKIYLIKKKQLSNSRKHKAVF